MDFFKKKEEDQSPPKVVKQVIIVRKDLNMRKGKIAAQTAHASMKVFFDGISLLSSEKDGVHIRLNLKGDAVSIKEWVQGSFAKIVVSVNSEDELIKCFAEAKARKLPCSLITDSGKTEFHGVPTKTACAIGPAEASLIDEITGKLELL